MHKLAAPPDQCKRAWQCAAVNMRFQQTRDARQPVVGKSSCDAHAPGYTHAVMNDQSCMKGQSWPALSLGQAHARLTARESPLKPKKPLYAAGAAMSEGELQDFVRGRLAAFKVPVRVEMSETALPRNEGGKLMKQDLRKVFET